MNEPLVKQYLFDWLTDQQKIELSNYLEMIQKQGLSNNNNVVGIAISFIPATIDLKAIPLAVSRVIPPLLLAAK